jgi:hypothetical protein
MCFAVTAAACSSSRSTSTPTTAPSTAPAAASTTTTSEPDDHVAAFRLPSGNVGCTVAEGTARCDVRSFSYTPPPKPRDCDLDWGDALDVAEGGSAGFVCHGDTAADPASPVLDYGRSTSVGGLVCTSAPSGVTCTAVATGHGFALSRDGYRLF